VLVAHAVRAEVDSAQSVVEPSDYAETFLEGRLPALTEWELTKPKSCLPHVSVGRLTGNLIINDYIARKREHDGRRIRPLPLRISYTFLTL
jgi:hypothetical protein